MTRCCEKQSEIEAQLKASAAKKARGKFKELAEDWYETEIEGGRLKHPAVPRRYLDKYMLPEFGEHRARRHYAGHGGAFARPRGKEGADGGE